MRKCNLCKKVILVSGLTLTMLMTACSGSEKPGDMLIGSWVSEYNDIVTFEKDRRCTAPFTYNASWWESADHYTVKEDGTLVLSSSEGHAGGSYEKVDTEEEALDDGSMYYLDKDKLIIEEDVYTRTK